MSTPASTLSSRHDVTLAVPPPLFDRPESPSEEVASTRVADRSGPSYPLWVSQFPQLFQHDGSCSPGLRVFQRALGEVEEAPESFGRDRDFQGNPSFATPQAIRDGSRHFARRCLSSAARVTNDAPSPRRWRSHSRAPAYRHRPSVGERHFLRHATHDPRGSGLGCGPCPPKCGRTHCPGLGSQATLCS